MSVLPCPVSVPSRNQAWVPPPTEPFTAQASSESNYGDGDDDDDDDIAASDDDDGYECC